MENVYGEVSESVGGAEVAVTNILRNPNQDPHLLGADVETAKAVSKADIAITNGTDCGPWLSQLLKRSPKAAGFPHLARDPKTFPAIAESPNDALAKRDAAHADPYRQRLKPSEAPIHALTSLIVRLKAACVGAMVTATEPVFGKMLSVFGIDVRHTGFLVAIMNNA